MENDHEASGRSRLRPADRHATLTQRATGARSGMVIAPVTVTATANNCVLRVGPLTTFAAAQELMHVCRALTPVTLTPIVISLSHSDRDDPAVLAVTVSSLVALADRPDGPDVRLVCGPSFPASTHVPAGSALRLFSTIELALAAPED